MSNTFYPIVAGRVSDSLNRMRSLSQLQYDQIAMNHLQTQLASGQRFTKPSEDPAAAIRVLALQRMQENQSQRLTNLNSANSYLSVTESSLSSASELLNSVKGLALEAVTNLTNEADRDALAFQLEDQINRLLTLGNSQFQDRYIYGGGLVRSAPFTLDAQGVVFNGDDLTLQTVGAQDTLIAHSVPSTAAFGVNSQGVVGTVDLNPALSQGVRLSQLNGGAGISPGAIQFSDGSNQVVIDLANTYRLDDIITKINAVQINGRDISAVVNGSHIEINYADNAGGILRVTSVGAGRTAADLGIETTVAAPVLPIVGLDLDPTIEKSTLLTDLNDGAGFSPLGGIRIHQGSKTYSVDFAGATTVEDMLIKINNSGAHVKAEITPDGRGMQVKSTLSGADFSISELNGDLATRLGLKTFHGDVRLADLNHGQGIFSGPNSDLEIVRNDGTVLRVNLEGAVTVNNVLSKINTHVDNQNPDSRVTAALNPRGNGIVLSSVPAILPVVSEPIRIRNAGGSQAATGLGLVPAGETEVIANVDGMGNYQITGVDPNPQEVKGLFNSLLRLREAVQSGNAGEIERISSMLDEDISRVSAIRGQIGVFQQKIDSLIDTTEDQKIQAAADQSNLLDTDFAAAIAELNARQTAYQASLRLLADMNSSTLFNYI